MNYLQAQFILEKFFAAHPSAKECTGCSVGKDSLFIKVPTDHKGEYPETFEGFKVNVRYQDEPGNLCND